MRELKDEHMPDRSMLLYPPSAAVSSVVSSCFIYELVKSTKSAFSRNTLLSVPSGNPRSETPHSLGIPVQRTPPHASRIPVQRPPSCLQNSEKPSVGGYGYFLESPNVSAVSKFMTIHLLSLWEGFVLNSCNTPGSSCKHSNTLFIFIRTSNFGTEAECSYLFWQFEPEKFLRCS